MLVPRYWAEARVQHRDGKRQITVRRFGWSKESQRDAERHAQERAQAAITEIEQGKKLKRRERKLGYGGTDGLPIREEIIAEYGDVVVTRNSYGAHCLNVSDVLFADIDKGGPLGNSAFFFTFLVIYGTLLIGEIVYLATFVKWTVALALFLGLAIPLMILSLIAAVAVSAMIQSIRRKAVNLQGGEDVIINARLTKFIENHPEWHVRVYETPNGFRILAMHREFQPNDPEVKEFFTAVQADRTYQLMCANQQCFRARLTGKPWRMGIDRYTPGGVWPVPEDRLPFRNQWIEKYEVIAKNYRAARFVTQLGSSRTTSRTEYVRQLHDDLSRVAQDLPIA